MSAGADTRGKSGGRRRAGPWLVAATLLLGCSFSQPVPSRTTLVFPEPTPVGHGPGCGVVRLHRVRAEPPFDRKAMLYRVEGRRYVADPYTQFYAPPGQVVRQLTGEWLTRARVFDMLIEPGDTRIEDWILVGTVSRMFVDRVQGHPDQAVLDVTYTLLARRGMQPEFERSYGAVVDVAAAGSPGAAWAAAIARVLSRLEGDLRVLLLVSEACTGRGTADGPAADAPE